MRKLIVTTATLIALLGITAVLILSCGVLPKSDETGLVRFEVGGGMRTSAWQVEEESYSLMVSVKRWRGHVVYEREVIELYRMGEGFISEPVGLEVGTYELTEYLVVV